MGWDWAARSSPPSCLCSCAPLGHTHWQGTPTTSLDLVLESGCAVGEERVTTVTPPPGRRGVSFDKCAEKLRTWVTALCLCFPTFKTIIITQSCPGGVAVGMCRGGANVEAVGLHAGKQAGLKEEEVSLCPEYSQP